MSYLLDANVFIQAKNLHYGLDFCPAFWEWIIEKNNAGKVYSIDKIADEISAGTDELTNWIKDKKKTLFLETDEKIANQFSIVSNWATNKDYEASAISTFFQVADFYLIAHALNYEFSVVTHEIPSSSTRRTKIPNACIDLKLKYMTPYEMLRQERAKFVLGHNLGSLS